MVVVLRPGLRIALIVAVAWSEKAAVAAVLEHGFHMV